MDWLVGCYEHLRSLPSTPRLLAIAGAWALFVSLLYLLCLRFFVAKLHCLHILPEAFWARPSKPISASAKALLLLRLALLGSSLLCFVAALVLIAVANPDAVPGNLCPDRVLLDLPRSPLSFAGLLPLVATSMSLATGGLVELNIAYTLSLGRLAVLNRKAASQHDSVALVNQFSYCLDVLVLCSQLYANAQTTPRRDADACWNSNFGTDPWSCSASYGRLGKVWESAGASSCRL